MRVPRAFSRPSGWRNWLPSWQGGAGLPRPPRPVLIRLAWLLGALVVLFGLGYAVAAVFIFPAPILAGHRTVPRLVGMSVEDARSELADLGLQAEEGGGERHDEMPQGHVVWQDPPPGTDVTEQSTVSLIVSTGPTAAIVPDVTDLDAGLAVRIIRAAGLRLTLIDSVQAPKPQGVVVVARPPAGTSVNPGTGIVLTVSRGAATVTVPSVLGFSLGDAQTALEAAGLVLGPYSTRVERGATPGTVVEQRPNAGTLAAPGTAVELFFARGR